jgi:hypothetical protein
VTPSRVARQSGAAVFPDCPLKRYRDALDNAGDVTVTAAGDGGDVPPDRRWMTYRELAELLKVEEESARRRAQRARWPRRPGNDGKTRVAVPGNVTPDDARKVARDDAGDDRGDNGGDVTPALAVELAELHERVGRAEGDAAAVRAELERIQAAHAAEMARMQADRDHERAERRAERQAAEAERARLVELLADATAPWWRRLLGRA